MAHFAELNENNEVLGVYVVSNDQLKNDDGLEVEELGIDFLEQLYGHRNWKQTSYNKSFRSKFAGLGYKYDSDKDAFIAPQPFPSWNLNPTTLDWEPPVPKPESQGPYYISYVWNEETLSWVNNTP